MVKIDFSHEEISTSIGDASHKLPTLSVVGSAPKIYITNQQRDDFLEGFSHGFVLQINDKRIGCYWSKDSEFEIDENGVKVWNLDEICISPDLSSTSEFVTHSAFDSAEEMHEAVTFIKNVFGQYDGNLRGDIVDDKPVLLWDKKVESRVDFTPSLQSKIDRQELVARS